MNDHELDEVLAAGAGMRDDDLRTPGVRAAMLAAADEVIGTPRPVADVEPRRRLGPRRARTLLAAAASVALLGVAVSVVTDDGRGGTPDPAGGATAAPTQVAADDEAIEIDARIIAATREAVAGSIVQITQVNVDGYRDTMWSDEVTGAFRLRTTSTDGTRPLLDMGAPSLDRLDVHRSVDHCFAEYADHTRRIGPEGRRDRTEPIEPSPPTSEVERIAEWIESGMVVADGTEVVDGLEMLRYRWVEESRTMLVDPETHRPTTIHGYPGTPHEYVQTYEFLERSPENVALLTPDLPAGYTLVEELRGEEERLAIGCA